MSHPLDPLTAEEIARVGAAVRDHVPGTDLLFSSITLAEPAKESLLADRPESPPSRAARVVVVDGPHGVIEAVVTTVDGQVCEWTPVADVRPPLLFSEAFNAMEAVRADPRWQAAVALRGITDVAAVQIDPWPAGAYEDFAERNTRITRCLAYHREDPADNGYARPIEGIVAVVDMVTAEVLAVEDHGVVALPADPGRYDADHVGPLRDGLKPLEISQPEGVSFTVDGNHLSWQRWDLRVGMDPVEGLVLYDVGYQDGDRRRSVLARAALSEMVVPYGSPEPAHRWKNAFDAGEWGLGRFVNSLTEGCDCLGEITYLDAVMANEQGDPWIVEQAICVHEEDDGIAWKHQDLNTGNAEVRRSRRFVVSAIFTVGNYEYAFYWRFYLDGSVELEVRLTGIIQPCAFEGEPPAGMVAVAPGLAAAHHQHLFCVRLDLDVDGGANSVYEVDVVPTGGGDDDPWANGIEVRSTLLASEAHAQRDVDPARSRVWKVVNPGSLNGLGQPVAYKLLPAATPTLLAGPESVVRNRARFATHNLWVTPYDPAETRAAGPYPNQHTGGDGLPAWTAADRPLVDTDVVLWHSFGLTHVVRPEDWPVMPVERTGFWLVPVGFFDRNPALDVPPPAHCEP
ncbi:MAG TPA: primary-amine oxidase [Acidimicrobiales bacterium]